MVHMANNTDRPRDRVKDPQREKERARRGSVFTAAEVRGKM